MDAQDQTYFLGAPLLPGLVAFATAVSASGFADPMEVFISCYIDAPIPLTLVLEEMTIQ